MSDIALRMYVWMESALASLRNDERGQDLLEYALLGGLIAGAIVLVTIAFFSGFLTSMFQNIGYCVDFTDTTTCDPGW